MSERCAFCGDDEAVYDVYGFGVCELCIDPLNEHLKELAPFSALRER